MTLRRPSVSGSSPGSLTIMAANGLEPDAKERELLALAEGLVDQLDGCLSGRCRGPHHGAGVWACRDQCRRPGDQHHQPSVGEVLAQVQMPISRRST